LLLTGNLSTSKDTRWDHAPRFFWEDVHRRRGEGPTSFGAWELSDEPAFPILPTSGRYRPNRVRARAKIEPFGSDPLHFVSTSYAVELVFLGKDVRRVAYLEPALLGAAWFMCILPCSIISASVLNLAPQVLHLYFFPNNPISCYHLSHEPE